MTEAAFEIVKSVIADAKTKFLIQSEAARADEASTNLRESQNISSEISESVDDELNQIESESYTKLEYPEEIFDESAQSENQNDGIIASDKKSMAEHEIITSDSISNDSELSSVNTSIDLTQAEIIAIDPIENSSFDYESKINSKNKQENQESIESKSDDEQISSPNWSVSQSTTPDSFTGIFNFQNFKF